jgi:3-methylcrotonyl-CoA carboxylase alpha subunit
LAFRRFGDVSERAYRFGDHEIRVRHLSTGMEVVVDGATHTVKPTLISETELITQFATSRSSATIIPVGLRLHVFTSGKHHQLDQTPSEVDVDAAATGSSSDNLTSPMPARVLEVRVKEGDAVMSGQVVCVLESMKMEINVRAGRDGLIGSVGAENGMVVEEGQVLVVLAKE